MKTWIKRSVAVVAIAGLGFGLSACNDDAKEFKKQEPTKMEQPSKEPRQSENTEWDEGDDLSKGKGEVKKPIYIVEAESNVPHVKLTHI